VQLSEMRDYIRNVVDIDTTDIADTTLNTFLREGYDAVVYSEKRWPFYEVNTTFTTVASQKDYTLAEVGVNITVDIDSVTGLTPGFREVNHLMTDNHVLEYLGRDDGDLVYPLDSNTTGAPWYWSEWGDSFRLYPTPSAGTTIYARGYRNAIEFGGNTAIYRAAIANTDTPDLPDPFDNVLSLYGIYRAYQQQEDSGMAQQYYVAFVGELDNLTARYKSTPAPQPVVLNSRRASRWLSQAILPNRLRYSWE
jgi:hypothetical protein